MKTQKQKRKLGLIPTLAIVLAAYLSGSPVYWRDDHQREVASIVSPIIAIYPNASQNLLAPYGWSAMNTQSALLGRGLVDRRAHFSDIYGGFSEIEYGHDVL